MSMCPTVRVRVGLASTALALLGTACSSGSEFGDLDGRLVVQDESAIIVRDPSGGNEVVLDDGMTSRNSQPTWSTDGSQVAWSSFDEQGPSIGYAAIDGSGTRSTRTPIPTFYLSWSEDDQWVAALGPAGTGVELFVTETATTEVRRVGVSQPFYFDWVDEERLVAALGNAVLADITIAGDVNERTLSQPLGIFQAPVALEERGSIVALATPFGTDVVLLSPDAEKPSIAATRGPVMMSPNPVDDRLAVLVAEAEPQSQVISARMQAPPNLPTGRVSIVDRSTNSVQTLDISTPVAQAWSPDGSTLAVLRADDDVLEWVFSRGDDVLPGQEFQPSETFATSYLPFADQYDRSSTWWSPDSRALVFAGTVDGQAGIHIDLVDDDSGSIHVGAGDIAFWSPK